MGVRGHTFGLELLGKFYDQMLIAAFRGSDFAVEVVDLMRIDLRRIDEFDTFFLEIEGLFFRKINFG